MPPTIRADIVTVFHNETNQNQAKGLLDAITKHERSGGFRFLGVDNTVTNRGFAAGCNLGAFHPDATAPIIGFLNPDVHVDGPFLESVEQTLQHTTVITGCRFGKPQYELETWGVSDWVCGATMFVEREWFTSVGGFDTQFVWGWEETDLIRQAERVGLVCRSILLPLRHDSPTENSPEDAAYKNHWFTKGGQRYFTKWPGRPTRRPVRTRR